MVVLFRVNQRNLVFEWVDNNMRTTKKRAKLSVYKLYISKAEKWEPINPFNIETNYFVYRIIWHCWGSAKVSHRAIVILTDSFQDMNVHSGIPKNVILSDGHIIRWALYSQINVLSPMKHTEAQGCDVLSRVSGRTKRTNPIWICIWFGNTKFAIFP